MTFLWGKFDILPPPHTILRFPVVKDAFTSNFVPTLNYGETHDLLAGPEHEIFLGFDLSELPEHELIYAKLIIHLAGKRQEGRAELHFLDNEYHWTERGITHANRPGTQLLQTVDSSDSKIEFDILDSILESYAIKSSGSLRFWARESGNAAYIEVSFLDPEAFKEVEGTYLPLSFGATASGQNNFELSWEGKLPYGEAVFPVSYQLSNHLLIQYSADPRFLITFTAQTPSANLFQINYGAGRSVASDNQISYTAIGSGSTYLPIEFSGLLFRDLTTTYTAIPVSNLKVAFAAHGRSENNFRLNFLSLERGSLIITFGSRALSKVSFPIDFTVYTSQSSEFELAYNSIPNSAFPINFQAVAAGENFLPITFSGQKLGVKNFVLEFTVESTADLSLSFSAQASDAQSLLLSYSAQKTFISDLTTTYLAQTRMINNLTVSFKAISTTKFRIDYEARRALESDFVIRFKTGGHTLPKKKSLQFDVGVWIIREQ